MAGSTILCGWWMQGTVAPVLGYLAVTAETNGRLAFTLIAGMGRTMAAMTGNTLPFNYRLMLDLVPGHLGFDIRMAIEADLSRLAPDETGLFGAVGAVTDEAFTIGKRRMGSFFSLFVNQLLMAC